MNTGNGGLGGGGGGCDLSLAEKLRFAAAVRSFLNEGGECCQLDLYSCCGKPGCAKEVGRALEAWARAAFSAELVIELRMDPLTRSNKRRSRVHLLFALRV